MAWILCFIALVAMIILLIKLFLIHKSLKEITDSVEKNLSHDTNRRILISSYDRQLCHFAEVLGNQLRVLKRQKRQYIQGNREVHDAITNISHDLRTPLTAIFGYLDLLEREELSPACRRYINQIAERSYAMKDLTEELFRYSVASSIPHLDMEKNNISKILENTLLSFYGLMKEKNIEPVIDLPDAPVWKRVDASALSRVFSNIITNAAKYSEGDFRISVHMDGRIEFSNTAPSLTAVDVGKMFDRYYTVGMDQASTGIGLSIAKTLTERMGGSIYAAYEESTKKLKITLSFDEVEELSDMSNCQ